MINFAVLLEASARRFPNKPALIAGPQQMTYGELNAAANQLANALRAAGIGRGDKVAFCIANTPHFAAAYFGVIKLGAVAVPINVLLKREQIAFQLADSEAKALIAFQGMAQLPIVTEARAAFDATPGCNHFWAIPSGAPDAPDMGDAPLWDALLAEQPATFDTVPVAADETCAISYSSGTTGQPKGAENAASHKLFNVMTLVNEYEFNSDDVSLIAAPLFSGFGRGMILFPTLQCGGTAILLPRFDASLVWDMLRTKGVTVFAGVPTMYHDLLHSPDAPSDPGEVAQWRLGMCGGAPTPQELTDQFAEKYKVPLRQVYGSAECRAIAIERPQQQAKAMSVGTPLWGVEMKILDPGGNALPPGERGEIAVRSPSVMSGYYKKDAFNAALLKDGWIRTGDVGLCDEDGYYFIVDRLKDMVIRGGHNVYPSEIEAVLSTHPDIALVSVIGIPDERLGEEVQACLTLHTPGSTTEDDIIAWAKEKLPAHAYPRKVIIESEMPIGPTGKILKKVLRQRYAD